MKDQYIIEELQLNIKLALENKKTFKVVETKEIYKRERPSNFDVMRDFEKILNTASCDLNATTSLNFWYALIKAF